MKANYLISNLCDAIDLHFKDRETADKLIRLLNKVRNYESSDLATINLILRSSNKTTIEKVDTLRNYLVKLIEERDSTIVME